MKYTLEKTLHQSHAHASFILSSSVDQESVLASYCASFRRTGTPNEESPSCWATTNTSWSVLSSVNTWTTTAFSSNISATVEAISWSYGTGNYVRPYSVKILFCIKF